MDISLDLSDLSSESSDASTVDFRFDSENVETYCKQFFEFTRVNTNFFKDTQKFSKAIYKAYMEQKKIHDSKNTISSNECEEEKVAPVQHVDEDLLNREIQKQVQKKIGMIRQTNTQREVRAKHKQVLSKFKDQSKNDRIPSTSYPKKHDTSKSQIDTKNLMIRTEKYSFIQNRESLAFAIYMPSRLDMSDINVFHDSNMISLFVEGQEMSIFQGEFFRDVVAANTIIKKDFANNTKILQIICKKKDPTKFWTRAFKNGQALDMSKIDRSHHVHFELDNE